MYAVRKRTGSTIYFRASWHEFAPKIVENKVNILARSRLYCLSNKKGKPMSNRYQTSGPDDEQVDYSGISNEIRVPARYDARFQYDGPAKQYDGPQVTYVRKLETKKAVA
jgi:hypothetical protein